MSIASARLALLLLALALAAAAAVVLRGALPGTRQRRLAARLAGVAGGRASGAAGGRTAAAARLRRRPARRRAEGADGRAARIAALFGHVPERRHQYPAPPWLIVAIAGGAALLLGAYAATAFGPPGWIAAPAAWIGGTRGVFGFVHRRRAEAMYAQLPDALAMVVRSVRAGIPVSEALRTVAREAPEPTGAEFRRLADQLAIGVALDGALRDLARRSGLPEYGFFKVALTLQGSAGGNLTETLENLADVVRKRVATRARGIALAAQARASAYVLAAVPAITGLALAAINPGYVAMLYDDPRGQAILALALLSLLTGLGTMRVIIRRSLA
ncbi:type II secretion system F family protein [Caldovatus aquaticus]|uniref:Type II secretion system F family protein n=1 Tax=Caldovatus aquaticus TaxID=2865671 RepID=A0ABS7F6L6_9PROT|nr:type II secretion system F family protein [Caldovatus aquaticus]MBW8271254.1 type II secretion system F family protein [Caldovatus aquaticus]